MPRASAPSPPGGRLAHTKLSNNLWETREYHTPDTPTLLKLGTLAGAEDRLRLDYIYSATSNNGNLLSHVIHQGGQTWTQKFSYDPLNRVQNSCETTMRDCEPQRP